MRSPAGNIDTPCLLISNSPTQLIHQAGEAEGVAFIHQNLFRLRHEDRDLSNVLLLTDVLVIRSLVILIVLLIIDIDKVVTCVKIFYLNLTPALSTVPLMAGKPVTTTNSQTEQVESNILSVEVRIVKSASRVAAYSLESHILNDSL